MGAILVSVIPPLILLAYIYKLDAIEHEPVSMLVKIFIFGMLATIPAIILEVIGDTILIIFGIYSLPGLYTPLIVFLVVAPAEEFCKRSAARLIAWNSPEFNYRFDAVVYWMSAALGFAAAENIIYLFDVPFTQLLSAAAVRMIPVHTICGLFMGHYLGQAKAAEAAGNAPLKKRYMRLSLIIPILIHGCYDFGVSVDSSIIPSLTLLGVVILTSTAFRSLKRYAAEDQAIISPGRSFRNYSDTDIYH